MTLKTKPQIMPAVTSVINVTTELSVETAGDFLDPSTRLALLRVTSTTDSELDWRRDYATDNQLGENAANWKGRRPADGDEDAFQDMLVVDDQIGPAMAREVDAQFGKDPEWDAVRGKAKLEDGDEIVTGMTEWHADVQLTAVLKDAGRLRFWAGQMVGRVYIPDEYAERLKGKDAPKTLTDALELVHIQAIDPTEGGPITDQHKRLLGYWYRYTRQDEEGKDQRVLEAHTPKHVLRFIEDQGKLTPDWTDTPADNPFHDSNTPARLRRAEYLMFHIDRDGGSAITTSVRHAQDRLNVVATYQGRNDDQTGYRQIVVSNAEQPVDKKGNAVPFPMGPGVGINLHGLKKPGTGQGLSETTDRHTPTWEVIDPLNPEEFHIPSKREWKRSLLEKLDQLWTLSPETNVSGESKRQSRKTFDNRVGFAAQDAGAFMAWALRAALMLAAQVLGKTSEYRDVTFQPKFYLDVDAANLEELRVKLQMWQQGALTLTTLLEATPGVTDAAKEAEAVDKGSGTSIQSDAKKAALDRLTGGTTGGDAPGATA